MPNDVSGLTVHEPDVGIFVTANANYGPLRQRFSFTHKYAHVLLDRETSGKSWGRPMHLQISVIRGTSNIRPVEQKLNYIC